MFAQDTALRRSCGLFCTQAGAQGYISLGFRVKPNPRRCHVGFNAKGRWTLNQTLTIFLRCVYTKHNSKPLCLGDRTRSCRHPLSQSEFSRAVQHPWPRRFFWCWNRNSGDTGGLVKEDWRELEWDKVTYLSLIGLRPWFLDWVGLNILGP